MNKQKLLIADSTEEFCSALTNILQGRYRIKTCQDGNEALELLRSFLPDVAVVDLMLTGLDGITLIQTAAEQGIHPTILATSRYTSDYVAESIEQLKVSYFVRKPCSVTAVATRIVDLSSQLEPSPFPQADPRTQITNALLHLGIPVKLNGYGYLREGIVIFSRDPSQSVTKELYPAIGVCFHCTREQVERSIRSAIEKAWSNRDPQIWNLYFPNVERRPSNGSFIARLADYFILKGNEEAEV